MYGVAASDLYLHLDETHLLRFDDGRIVENVVGSDTALSLEMLFADTMRPVVLPAFFRRLSLTRGYLPHRRPWVGGTVSTVPAFLLKGTTLTKPNKKPWHLITGATAFVRRIRFRTGSARTLCSLPPSCPLDRQSYVQVRNRLAGIKVVATQARPDERPDKVCPNGGNIGEHR